MLSGQPSAILPTSSLRMATNRSARRRSFGLAKTGGIDLETRNSRRQSPIHVSHPGESTQIHSADYRLPILWCSILVHQMSFVYSYLVTKHDER
jgi:hypothetical protein